MKQTTQVELRMTRGELHDLFEGLIQHGRHKVTTPEGVMLTFIRENGITKESEGNGTTREPKRNGPLVTALGRGMAASTEAAIKGAEEGGRAK